MPPAAEQITAIAEEVENEDEFFDRLAKAGLTDQGVLSVMREIISGLGNLNPITENRHLNFNEQMRRRFFIMLSLMFIALAAHAQKSNGCCNNTGCKAMSLFQKNMIVEFALGTGTKKDDIQQLEAGGVIGYRFIPKMYAFARGGMLYGFCDNDEGRHYTKSNVLGGGLGYTLCRFDNTDIDFRASVGSSIGNADWKHTVYDAGFVARIGNVGNIKMNAGLGYRHISSRTAGIDAYNGLYATLGFGF